MKASYPAFVAVLALGASAAHSQTGWAPKHAAIETRWAKDVSPTDALPDYPRPQMVRKAWQNLNGVWELGIGERGRRSAARSSCRTPSRPPSRA